MYLLFLRLSLLVAGALARPSLFESRVVNGQEADKGEWPWQVMLVKYFFGSWYFICGGSLLTENTVVTAAHCVDTGTASNYKVILGEHIWNINEGTEQAIFVKSIDVHAGYVDSNTLLFPNDIAVLTLANNAILNDHVATIELGSRTTSTAECFMTGWGKTESESSSEILMEASATVISNSDCQHIWGDEVNEGQICLLNYETGVCSGDSGGPLSCRSEGTWYLMGIASWAHSKCAEEDYAKRFPSAFTRVSFFAEWVRDRM